MDTKRERRLESARGLAPSKTRRELLKRSPLRTAAARRPYHLAEV